MKIFLLCILIINLYGVDLKNKIINLQKSPEKTKIINVKYDPFQNGKEVVQKVSKEKKQIDTLYITTILNNRIFVNSKWYKVGDKINEYKIVQISKNSILARKDGKLVKLGIKKSQKLLKIRDKKQ